MEQGGMATCIDRRLREKIGEAGEAGLVEGVFVFKAGDASVLAETDEGLTQQVIESAILRSGEQPETVRYFPRANAAVVTASSRFMQEILKDKRLAVASATDVDAFFVF